MNPGTVPSTIGTELTTRSRYLGDNCLLSAGCHEHSRFLYVEKSYV
jgi:hypothetical protein